jgi:hypothetical protein
MWSRPGSVHRRCDEFGAWRSCYSGRASCFTVIALHVFAATVRTRRGWPAGACASGASEPAPAIDRRLDPWASHDDQRPTIRPLGPETKQKQVRRSTVTVRPAVVIPRSSSSSREAARHPREAPRHPRSLSRHPRPSGDPVAAWVPAFAGMTGHAAGLRCGTGHAAGREKQRNGRSCGTVEAAGMTKGIAVRGSADSLSPARVLSRERAAGLPDPRPAPP